MHVNILIILLIIFPFLVKEVHYILWQALGSEKQHLLTKQQTCEPIL